MRVARWCGLAALLRFDANFLPDLRVQPLEGPVDRSTENGLLASQPCRAVRS